MNDYSLRLKQYADEVNFALHECIPTEDGLPQGVVVEAMRYSLLDAGKRLRAALTLELARMCDGPAVALPLACAVEMVHAYSLIHDDLPCMDNDDFRRGKPSCHKAFGEANALLAGDALLTLAFETAAKANGLSPEQRLSAVAELSAAAGFRGMIGGQVIDLESEGKALPLSGLDRLNSLKTGALLRVSARLGCIAGGADERILSAADRFAAAYGLAFQITDDILDVTGDSATLGKPVGSDRDSEKNTYAALLGVDGARAEAKRLADEAKKSAAELPDGGFLCWLADMTLTREK